MPRTYLVYNDAELDSTLSGEQALVVAIVRQLLDDAQHPDLAVRRDVQRFLNRGGSLTYWTDLLALDEGIVSRLEQEMRRRLAHPRPAQSKRHSRCPHSP